MFGFPCVLIVGGRPAGIGGVLAVPNNHKFLIPAICVVVKVSCHIMVYCLVDGA